MENSRTELESFKQEINLVNFAIAQGGYDYKKGYQNKTKENTYIALAKNEGTPEHEYILVRRNPSNGHFLYFNPENSFDKGTIIDFCANKLNLSIGETRVLCRSFMGHSQNVTTQKTKLTPSPPLKQSVIDESYFDIKPITKESVLYLKDRGINENVINSPLFYSSLGTKTVIFEDDKGKKHKFDNTAFLIKSVEGRTIGLALKNRAAAGSSGSFTANLEESSTFGMWVSNPPSKTTNLTFAIVEHPIDALSHYQLNYNALEGPNDIMYFSSNGTLRESHIEFVQHYIDQYKPEQILLLNDNDNAGLRFNISYLGKLKEPGVDRNGAKFYHNEDCKIECHFAKPINVLKIEIHNTRGLNNKEVLENIDDYFKAFNSQLHKQYGAKEEEFSIKKISQTDVITEITIHFDNRMELLKDAIGLAQDLRPSQFIKVQLPQSKDYNQDLVNTIKAREKGTSTSFQLGK